MRNMMLKLLKILTILVLLFVISLFCIKIYDYFNHFDEQNVPIQTVKNDLSSASIRAFLFGRKNDFADISKKTKEALVNIICIPKTRLFQAISGTGVIVDERGVILTNAHIGQYFLLKNFTQKDFVGCVIRMGDPAKPLYTAQLFYIPHAWVTGNAEMLKKIAPTGTGENDFALLLIDKKIDSSPLPSSFPSLNINSDDIMTSGKEVLVAGYPAGVLGGVALDRDLYAISAVVTINQIQTFGGTNRDFLLLSPSSVAERGSSGGAVVDKNNELVSLIVSVRNAGIGLIGELGTLTISHVNRSMSAEAKMSLLDFLNQDINALVTNFWKTKAPEFIREYSRVFSI